MQKIFVPIRIKLFIARFVLLLGLMSLTRVLFWVANTQRFTDVVFSDFFVGAWFDCITIAMLSLPYVVIALLPLPSYKVIRISAKVLFFIVVLLVLLLNLMDIEYFKYTGKRSTIDLFDILSAGSDFKQQVGVFIIDFWWLVLAFLVLLLIVYWTDHRLNKWFLKFRQKRKSSRYRLLKLSVWYVFAIGTMIFIARGGLVYKSVGVLDASRFVNSEKTSLVLNTPFTMIKSVGNDPLKELHYYTSIEETERYFSPIKSSQPQYLLPDNTNVVILILESFGKEFIGFYNHQKTYTPFLDSLLSESLTFSNGFANGKKSIEALPSIFASIPSLQDKPYISSPYNANRLVGLPELLKKYGYESAFFHGATNGSMRFDAFTKSMGFDHYFGRTEYANEQHADQTWGILDEHFEPWTARQISTLKEPFLASMFTLSSHHPFYIPPHRQKEVIKGEQPICASISYGDLSLRLFFEEAKKQPWYPNTLFVICADHTPGTQTEFYNQRTQLYQIPIAYFHPSGMLTKNNSEKITQQADIYPTIVDLLNIKTIFYAFGESIFSSNPRFVLNYLQGDYFYFEDNKMLVFSQSLARSLQLYSSKELYPADIMSEHLDEAHEYERRLKAVLQRYNHDLIHNKTTAWNK